MPKNTKVSRCVEKVKKQGGDVNPYAVCQASTGENYMTGKKIKKSLPQGPKQGTSTRDPKSPTYKEKPESKYDQRSAKTGEKPNKEKAMTSVSSPKTAAPVKPQKKTQIARPYSAHTKPAAPRPNAHEEVQYDKSLADGTKAQQISYEDLPLRRIERSSELNESDPKLSHRSPKYPQVEQPHRSYMGRANRGQSTKQPQDVVKLEGSMGGPYGQFKPASSGRGKVQDEINKKKSIVNGTKAQPTPGSSRPVTAPKPNAAAQYYQQQDTRNKQGAPARSRVSMFAGGGEQQVSQDNTGKYTAKQLVKHLFSQGTKSLIFYDKMLNKTSDENLKKLLVKKLETIAKELDDLEKLNKELGERHTYEHGDYMETPHKRAIVPGMSQAERRLVNKQNAPSTPKPEIQSSGRGREVRSRTSN